jgi:hypothetical protein
MRAPYVTNYFARMEMCWPLGLMPFAQHRFRDAGTNHSHAVQRCGCATAHQQTANALSRDALGVPDA